MYGAEGWTERGKGAGVLFVDLLLKLHYHIPLTGHVRVLENGVIQGFWLAEVGDLALYDYNTSTSILNLGDNLSKWLPMNTAVKDVVQGNLLIYTFAGMALNVLTAPFLYTAGAEIARFQKGSKPEKRGK